MKKIVLSVCLMFSPLVSAAAPSPMCEPFLSARKPRSEHDAMKILAQNLPVVFERPWLEEQPWYQLLRYFAIPALRFDSDVLVASFVGGGNLGKSTLLNAIPSLLRSDMQFSLNDPVSKTGFYPGLTKRMVIMLPEFGEEFVSGMKDLEERYGKLVEQQSIDDAMEPGPGLLVSKAGLPKRVAFVDTPDFDTGNIDAAEPDNFRRAMRVICPSDVLILVFNPQTVRNLSNAKLMLKIFEDYGLKQTILVFWGDPAMPEQEIRQLLIHAANSIYGTASADFPSPVLGAYRMPYSSEVPAGRSHPELKPLSPFPPFAELIGDIDRRAPEIKSYSIRTAGQLIEQRTSGELRLLIQKKMAAQIYAAAVPALISSVAYDTSENFPYSRYRDQIRARYRQLSSRLSEFVQRTGDWLALPEKEFLARLERFMRSPPPQIEELQEDHGKHDILSVTEFVVQLQHRRLNLRDTPVAKRLAAMIEEYQKYFPEEKETQFAAVEKGRRRLTLPRHELLSPEAQKQLKEIFSADLTAKSQSLSRALNVAQFDSRLSPQASVEIYRALAAIHDHRPVLHAARVHLLDLATVALPAGATYYLAYHGIDSVLLHLLAINLAARPPHFLSDVDRDRYLERSLNDWRRRLYDETTTEFLTESIAKDFLLAVSEQDEAELRAIGNVQAALKFLNPKFEVLPVLTRSDSR